MIRAKAIARRQRPEDAGSIQNDHGISPAYGDMYWVRIIRYKTVVEHIKCRSRYVTLHTRRRLAGCRRDRGSKLFSREANKPSSHDFATTAGASTLLSPVPGSAAQCPRHHSLCYATIYHANTRLRRLCSMRASSMRPRLGCACPICTGSQRV